MQLAVCCRLCSIARLAASSSLAFQLLLQCNCRRWRSGACCVGATTACRLIEMQPMLLAELQVAERSLFLWNNEYIVQLVAQHRETVRICGWAETWGWLCLAGLRRAVLGLVWLSVPLQAALEAALLSALVCCGACVLCADSVAA